MEQHTFAIVVQYSVSSGYWMVSYEVLFKYEVLLLIFTNCDRFEKEAVVSGTAYFCNCGTVLCQQWLLDGQL